MIFITNSEGHPEKEVSFRECGDVEPSYSKPTFPVRKKSRKSKKVKEAWSASVRARKGKSRLKKRKKARTNKSDGKYRGAYTIGDQVL